MVSSCFLWTKILTCVSMAHFSTNLHGKAFGFFPSGRGLRQWDPIFLLLFVLVMGCLSRSLELAMVALGFAFILPENPK